MTETEDAQDQLMIVDAQTVKIPTPHAEKSLRAKKYRE